MTGTGRRHLLASIESLAGYLVNGVVLGSILALAGIGLTLVYGILRFSNFAHGDLLTTGAYVVFAINVGWAASTGQAIALATIGGLAAWLLIDILWLHRLHRPERLVLAAVAAGLAVLSMAPGLGAGLFGPGFLVGVVLAMVWLPALLIGLEKGVWDRLRKMRANTVTFIVASIGLALVLRNLMALLFGTDIVAFDMPSRPSYRLGPAVVTAAQMATVAVTAIVVTGVHVLLRHTRTGRSLRAVADNPELARVTGIDVPRMTSYVWILAGALAALAGTLLAWNANVHPNLGWHLLLPIFAAVILGGIGSPYGALLGAFVIAIAMEMSVAWIPEYRLAVGFVILIVTMFVRPQGILGVKR